ncbi:PepSY domain-containing protein [Undibacterium sp. RuTC16W]|uniref:PepSY domain-containing protein n=1 Tax=Undibacterium sp. RuTC16W TaxID=3413048 RepID=UPI003BF1F92D
MFRFTKIAIAITSLTTVSLGAFAYANKGTENDAIAVASAKVTMVQAVTTAEQHANGKASRVEYEQSKAGWVYDVEVVSGAKVFDVRVDAEKGSIISSVEDKADRDDDHDKPD